MPAAVAKLPEVFGSINQNILFVASFSKQQKLNYNAISCSYRISDDPQHHGTLLICWTNYCAVLCFKLVVVMCVLLLCCCLCLCLSRALVIST